MIREFGNPSADIVLIQPVDEQELSSMESEAAEITRLSQKDFRLIAYKVDRWNDDLSPWRAPAVFGSEDFGDGAKETLEKILRLCEDKEKTYIIGGYSLAGLFALWASGRTDVFAAVAAASPSVWFPGFLEDVKANPPLSSRVYLSLGDKEEKTKHPVMATVGTCIRETFALFQEKGIRCTLEWNPGNHFKDPDLRMAKAFAWGMGVVLCVKAKGGTGYAIH